MLTISSYLFVTLIISCMLGGVILCLLIIQPVALAMRRTNAEYQNQVGVQGLAWQEIFERQQDECDRYNRIACDMERRLWIAVRIGYGEKKGPGAAMADKMLDPSAAPLPGNSSRTRHRGPLTRSEEVKLARKARLDQLVSQGRSVSLGAPESTDGTNQNRPA